MNRRKFIKSAGIGVAAAASTTLAAPAIAQSGEIRWRMTASWPKSLDTLFGGCEYLAKRVSDATGGKFRISTHAAGEIVPALQVLDAVSAGTVECGHTAPYYYIGKDPTFAFATAIPFGLNARQQFAWMEFGEGRQLMNEFYKDYNIIGLTAGNTGAQMGGWFRKELKSAADLKGLKMRIGGFAGQVLSRPGLELVPQQLGAPDIYPALEKGTIDAAEWVGPYDDEKLGFNKVASFYYYPGWWEGGPQLDLMVGIRAWESLSSENKAILQAASHEAYLWMVGKYDAQNPAALRRLIAGGAKLRAFPRDIMAAAWKASNDLYGETTAKNAKFKKIYDNWSKFRDEENRWFRFAEGSFDNFMQSVSLQPVKKT